MPNQVQVGNQDVVLRTAIAEAASEGALGLQAVLAVMANRARKTGLTMEQIATQAGQFEPHMTDAGRQRMARINPRSTLYRTTGEQLAAVLGGADPTGGADHFYAPVAQRQATDGRAPVPRWAQGRKPSAVIGGHEFYSIGYGNRNARTSPPTGSTGASPAIPAATPPVTADQALSGAPVVGSLSAQDILGGELPERAPRTTATQPTRQEIFAAALTAQTAKPDQRAEVHTDTRQEIETGFLSNSAVDTWDSEHSGPMDSLGASIRLNSVTGSAVNMVRNIMSGVDRSWDEGFDYSQHQADWEQGLSQREADRLREGATNFESGQLILERIQEDRALQGAIGTGFWGGASQLAGGFIDPLGYLAGGVVGKGFQAVGVGSRMLAMQGSRSALVASLAAEGAAGNLLATAAIDAMGTYTTPGDYVSAGMFGAGLGVAATPFVSRAGNASAGVLSSQYELADAARDAAARTEIEVLQEATARLGDDATPEQIGKMAETIHGERAISVLDNTMNPVPAENMVLHPDRTLDPDTADRLTLETQNVAEDTERNLVMQTIDSLERIDRLNPHTEASDAGEAAWMKTGQASSGLIMLRSEYAPLRGAAKILAEGASGHSGRRHSAAMEVVIRDTEFNRTLLPWDSNFGLWRKSKGYGLWETYMGDMNPRREFNAAVSAELRGRARPDLYAPSSDPYVRRAADIANDFYRKAGEEQVRWNTVGSEGIKPGDTSYFPQAISAEAIVRLQSQNPKLLNAYQGIIREQARDIFGWDDKFSEYFARRYIATAARRASGGYDAPANLAHHMAGDFVQDLLINMRQGASADELIQIDATVAKFARGGASYTKGRLDFDVMHTYDTPEGKIKLLDILEQDQLALMRRYGRRAAGEIALSKFGIPGKHGVDVLRKSIEVGHQQGKVTNAELQAFDQLVSEILNVPMAGGGRANRAMENARLLTSAIKLGGMGITQFAESGNGFASIGVGRTFSSIAAMPRLVGEIRTIKKGERLDNPILRSFEQNLGYEFGITDYITDRAFDVRDNQIQLYGNENLSFAAKASRGLSHAQAVLSAQRVITAVQTRGMAEQIIRKAVDDIKRGKKSAALEDMGFSPALQEALSKSMDKITTYKGGKLVGVDIRAGDLTDAQIAQITSSVLRGSSQIIQRTYPGEVGKWAHDDFLKLLFQFRTFSLTAVEKQWGRNIKTHGHAKALATLIGSMSFAAPIHLARVNARAVGMEDSERKEYLEKQLSLGAVTQATLNYASASGLLGDVWDIGGGAVSGTMSAAGVEAPDWLSGTINPRGTGSNSQLLGGKIAPAAGVVQDAFSLVNGRWDRARSLLPGQAHPALVVPLNAAEAALSPEDE